MPATDDDTLLPFSLPNICKKKVTAAFDGGQVSSDGGVFLLASADKRLGLIDQANRTSDLLACDKNACPIRFGSILPPWVSNKLGRSRWIGSLRASKAWMTQGAGTPPCMISMLF